MTQELPRNSDREADRPEAVSGGAIEFDRARRLIRLARRALLPEDGIALSFAGVLERSGVNYVVVAGYVAILFGRGRRSDDVDFIVEDIDEDRFVGLCRAARAAGFRLMQGNVEDEGSVRIAYRRYLAEGYGVRFMYGDVALPNVEVKLARTEAHRYALANAVRVVMNDGPSIRISPLELQVAYKLYLGTEKDVGDAVFLYTLFRDFIDDEELKRWCRRLGVDCRILEGV